MSDGHLSSCKDCRTADRRKYYEKNKERIQKQCRAYYQANRDSVLEVCAQYARLHRERANAASRRWRKRNLDKQAAAEAKRRAALLQATPPWADLDKIQTIYTEARRLTLETGILHTVDHIIPLQGKQICGLHVEGNLQILTKSENSRKGNKWPFKV